MCHREVEELSGYMEENAFIRFRNGMPVPDMEHMMALFQKAQEIYASYGITTVQEGMVTKPLFQMLQYAEKKHIFYLDLAGYIDLQESRELLLAHKEYLGNYRNHFKIGGKKTWYHGYFTHPLQLPFLNQLGMNHHREERRG